MVLPRNSKIHLPREALTAHITPLYIVYLLATILHFVFCSHLFSPNKKLTFQSQRPCYLLVISSPQSSRDFIEFGSGQCMFTVGYFTKTVMPNYLDYGQPLYLTIISSSILEHYFLPLAISKFIPSYSPIFSSAWLFGCLVPAFLESLLLEPLFFFLIKTVYT